MGKSMFKIGDKVKIASDNDNENYDKFRGKILTVSHVATSEKQHRGYDSGMEGMALYDFNGVPFSLYEYEIEPKYAKGSTVKGDKWSHIKTNGEYRLVKGEKQVRIGYLKNVSFNDITKLVAELNGNTSEYFAVSFYLTNLGMSNDKNSFGSVFLGYETENDEDNRFNVFNIEEPIAEYIGSMKKFVKDWHIEENEEYAKGSTVKGGGVDKMDKFISELAKKNTKEFSVNEYHDFRNKKYAIGVARHYFTDNDGSFSKFDTKLGDALNIDFETQGDSNKFADGGSTVKGGKYYQPDLSAKQWESGVLNSWDVFKSKEVAKKSFPKNDILEYSGDDIEEHTFVDNKYAKGSTVNSPIVIAEMMWNKKDREGKKEMLIIAEYSNNVADDLSRENWSSLEKQVHSNLGRIFQQGRKKSVGQYAKGSTVGGKKYQYYILQTKDGKVNWVVPKKIATIEEIVENAKKYNINIFASNFGTWESKRENGNRYTTEIVNEDGSDFKTDKEYNEISRAIGVVKKVKYGNGGGVAVSSESGLAVGTNADLMMNQNNLQYGSGGAIKSADEGTGSTELREMAQVKIDKGMTVIDFSYTDYGGSFGDKVAIAYFKKHYPKNILLENSGYNGQNAFVFGKVADEYLEETKNYPLGFEDMEEFYFNMQMRMEEVEFKSFVKQLKSDGYKVSPNTFDWLIENKGGYYHIEPNMVDYSPEDLTEELIEEGLVSKKFGNGGGVAVSSQSEMDSVEDTKSHFGYDNESWNELSKEEKIKMRKLAKEHLLLGAKSNESSPYWDYSIGGL